METWLRKRYELLQDYRDSPLFQQLFPLVSLSCVKVRDGTLLEDVGSQVTTMATKVGLPFFSFHSIILCLSIDRISLKTIKFNSLYRSVK